jgi:hypothetical protein
MESLNHMQPKDLSTIILSMAKIAKTIREAKRRRKMNTTHLIFCQLYFYTASHLSSFLVSYLPELTKKLGVS